MDISSVTAARTPIEPDYRFTLANERTFLAWQRTSLGLMAAAVAVVQFMPELAIPGLRHVLGVGVGVIVGPRGCGVPVSGAGVLVTGFDHTL